MFNFWGSFGVLIAGDLVAFPRHVVGLTFMLNLLNHIDRFLSGFSLAAMRSFVTNTLVLAILSSFNTFLGSMDSTSRPYGFVIFHITYSWMWFNILLIQCPSLLHKLCLLVTFSLRFQIIYRIWVCIEKLHCFYRPGFAFPLQVFGF